MAGSKWISNERVWFNRRLLTRVLALFYWIAYKLPTSAVFRQRFKYTMSCLSTRQSLRSNTAWFTTHFFLFAFLSIMHGAEKVSCTIKVTCSVERRKTTESKRKWFLVCHLTVWLSDCVRLSISVGSKQTQLSSNTACCFNHLKTKNVKVLLYPLLPDFRNSIALWKVPRLRLLSFCQDKCVDEDEYGALMEWYWQRKTEVLGEKPVPMPLYPQQISHGLA
jgi:hypothetical protein